MQSIYMVTDINSGLYILNEKTRYSLKKTGYKQ